MDFWLGVATRGRPNPQCQPNYPIAGCRRRRRRRGKLSLFKGPQFADAVVRYSYTDGDTESATPGIKVAALPAGALNHHWTKSLIASADGSRLYVGVGSNSNVGENELDKEERRACILEIDVNTGQSRIFASGLRNPVGMAWEPETGVLWTVVNAHYPTLFVAGFLFFLGFDRATAAYSTLSDFRTPLTLHRLEMEASTGGRLAIGGNTSMIE